MARYIIDHVRPDHAFVFYPLDAASSVFPAVSSQQLLHTNFQQRSQDVAKMEKEIEVLKRITDTTPRRAFYESDTLGSQQSEEAPGDDMQARADS